MSLLMDALKKAESVKQQGRRQPGGSAQPHGGVFERVVPRSHPIERSLSPQSPESPSGTVPLALEMDGPDLAKPFQSAATPGCETIAVEPGLPAPESSESSPGEAQGRGLPSPNSHSEQSADPGFQPQGPFFSSELEPSERRVQAQNMFRSKEPRAPSKRRRFLMMTGIGILALLTVSGQGYRVLSEQSRLSLTATTAGDSSPRVFSPSKPEPLFEPLTLIQERSEGLPGPPDPPSQPQRADAQAGRRLQGAVTLPQTSAKEPVSDTPPRSLTEEVKPQTLRLESARQLANLAPVSQPSVSRNIRDAQEGVPAIGRLEVLRTTRADPLHEQITSAYQAFMGKDFQGAKSLYMKTLESDGNNRDALLGLAAIAVASGYLNEATRIYGRLLELDPMDGLAHAGLLAYGLNSAESEARIRMLLEREPNSHVLHFALGNHYVAQSRWPEAQQAFFDAFRLDSQNPDYAFNLAVGLEHLRQPRKAAEHYQRALELSERRPSAFDQETARARLRQLIGSGTR